MTIGSMISEKGVAVHSVRRNTTVQEAAALLKSKRIGVLIISDNGETIDGILSERDIVRGLAGPAGADMLAHPVERYMTRGVVTCAAGDTMTDAMRLMTENRIRHLPVVEEGKIRGVISIGDVVKRRLRELEADADAMRDFIATAG